MYIHMKGEKMNIAIVDDHQVFRKSLNHILKHIYATCEITESNNGSEFLEQMQEIVFDIVLMDVNMPLMNGITTTYYALKKQPDLKVLAVSMHSDNESFHSMMEAGAKGYILKGSGINEIKNAIHDILHGKFYFSFN